jgi:hypothetical protein
MNPRTFLARLGGVAAIVAALSVPALAQDGSKQRSAIVGVSGMT